MATVPVEEIAKVVPDPRWDPENAPEGAKVDSPEIPGNSPETPRNLPGKSRLRPITAMKEQLKASSAAGEQSRVKFWMEHRSQISKLPKADLEAFVKDMNANRRFITQLLKLIKEETEGQGS